MKKTIVMEKYPVYSLEIKKSETSYKKVSEIIAYFQKHIENHQTTALIGIFDHYEHTKNLENGEISEDILDAKNIVFCFGQKIMDPIILAVRPRSIGVVETNEAFVISFLEAPMEPAHKTMEEWARNLILS